MADDLSIVLKALVDQYSLKDIITQINDLSKKAIIKTDVLINDESLKKISKSFDNIGEKAKNLSKVTLFSDSNGKAFKQINELTNALGDIERKIYTLNKEGNLELSNTVEISNLKKQQEEYQKVINLLQRIDNAKNKVYENLDSQYGFIDIKSLEKVDKSLNGINLDTENLFVNYKQINNEVKAYEKQLKSLENNALKQRQIIDYTQTIQQVKELENAEKELAKWKEDFSKGNINDIDYEILRQETLSKIKSDAIRQQLEEQVRLNVELDKQNTLEREISLAKQNLQNKLNDITVKNDKYNVDELNRLREAISNVNADTPKAKLKLRELSSEITQFGIEAKKTSSTTNSFSDSLKRFLTFYSLHDVIRTTKIVVRELVDTVYELAESLLEIQKVSDLSGKSLDSFVKQSYKIGDILSKTGKDVIDATTIFKRAGYDLGDSTYLAKNAIIMQAVAENINNVGDASSSLISILKGYNKEISDSTHIIDSFNQVSNTQAVNFDTLVEGASRISAVMRQQGNSFEQMLGLLTGATEVLGVDSIERVSTQLRTLSLRLASMNEETGKFEPEIVSALNDEFERLAGISLVDENKQIKSTYEIMSAMAKVMPTLDKNTRSYLMELASGKRGMETMEAIITNWQNVEKATSSAINSYGSSTDEFEKYTNSILGKTEKLKGAIEELSITSLSSDFVSNILDSTTAVVKLTTATGGLTPVVIGLVTAFTLLNAIKIKNTVTDIIAVFAKLGLQAKITTASINSTIVALGGLSVVSKTLLGIGIVAGVMAISYAFNKLKNSAEESLDKTKQKISELKDEISNLNSSKSTFSELTEEFKKLSDPIGRTVEETQRFYEVQNQLKDILPEINGYYDEQGNFIITSANNQKELNKQLQDYIDLKKEQLAEESKKTASATIDSFEEQKRQIEELSDMINSLNKSKDATSSLDLSKLNADEKLEISGVIQENTDRVDELTQKLNKLKDESKLTFSEIQSSILNIVGGTEQWNRLTEEQRNSIRKLLSESDSVNVVSWLEDLQSGTITIDNLISRMQNLIPNFKELGKVVNDSESDFVSLEKRIEKFNSTASEMNKINDILQSLKKNGALTSSEVNDLLEISEDFAFVLNDEVALRDKLGIKLDEYKGKHKQAYYDMVKDSTEYYDKLVNGSTSTHKELLIKLQKYIDDKNIGYGVDLKNYKTLEEAKLEITKKLISKVAGVWAKYFDASTGEASIPVDVWDNMDFNARKDFQRAKNEIPNKLKALSAELENIVLDNYSPTFDSSLKSSSSTDKWIEEFQKKYKEIQYLRAKDIITTQQYYDVLNSLNQKYFANRTKYIEEYRQYDLELYNLEKELSNKRIKDLEFQNSLLEFNDSRNSLDSTQKQIDIYKQMQNEVHKLAENARKRGIAENDDYIQELRKQWMNYSNDIESLIISSYEKQNQLLEDKINLLDIEQSKYKEIDAEYINITNQKYDLILQQEELLKKKVSELYKEGFKEEAKELEKVFVDLYQKRIELAKEYQSIEINSLQSQINILEEQKKSLESLHDMTLKMIKDELNARKKQYQDEISDIKKVFEAKKKSIRDEQNLRSYNKGLTEKTAVVADLENQLAIIKNDETAIAKRKKLEEELAKAKQDLEDYQYDRSIELQEDALDRQLELETDKLQKEIDLLDDTLSNEVKLRELANERIRKSGEKLKNQLIAHAKEYGSFTVEEISNAWDIAGKAVVDFDNKQKGLLETLKEISQELIDTQKRLKEVEKLSVDEYSASIGKPTTGVNKEQTITKMQSNSQAWNNANAEEKKRLSEENQKLGKALGLTYDSQSGVWYYDKQKKLRVYHEGGIVGGSNYATKSTEELAKLLKGELVITPHQAEKLMSMVTNNTNNSESFSPTLIFNFEGQPNESLLQQFKDNGKLFAKLIFDEMEKSDARRGFKKKFGTT